MVEELDADVISWTTCFLVFDPLQCHVTSGRMPAERASTMSRDSQIAIPWGDGSS